MTERELVFNENTIIELFTAVMCLGEIIGVNNRLHEPMSIKEIKIMQREIEDYHKLLVLVFVNQVNQEVIERAKIILNSKYGIKLNYRLFEKLSLDNILESVTGETPSPLILIADNEHTIILYEE